MDSVTSGMSTVRSYSEERNDRRLPEVLMRADSMIRTVKSVSTYY